MICSACGAANEQGRKFCGECGTRLARSCPACGFANPPSVRFCGECGTRLDEPAAAVAPGPAAQSTMATGPAAPTPPTPQAPPGPADARAIMRSQITDFTRNLVASALASSGVLAPGQGASPNLAAAPASPAAPAAPASAPATEAAPVTGTIHETERRIVSILFADLVGFTARSDGSDPEQVREFLTRYFDIARDIVGRYGGTIEKFIGDAVMAAWGTPVVREDDAERAVRAGLDLVEAVRRLGRDAGDDALECRAAVLTGEAAVSPGATDQALVAGDLVNTASRLQAAAPPGAVLVGEATERAANRAILFEPAGEQNLKGKQAPIAAWRALRVVAERGGRNRTETVEAPFVGRDEELRYLKDAYHATARERRSRLVSITGQAGIGKSRLAWEFSKYMDGLLEEILWHQGRSPAYGEGITFWALGEMVRRRARLQETDDEATTRARIAETLVEYVADEAERRWIGPTLLYLLGIGGAPSGGREELFAAWRTFFERLASVEPAVLVFEDLQWADNGLLDFIDHLLDWSKSFPILVVTLARPELLDRRPGWGAGRRNYIALSLEPLPEPAMRDLLAGLVPGLPEQATQTILGRAGGIPLYAVETVRMLVAEGRLEQVDTTYRPVGDLSHLKVPESLQALVAARLDALSPADRSLLQDASVLGQTFSTPALAAVAGASPEAIEPRLRDLARREVLSLDTDPRSPERGQYGFNQALIREVAYSTLAKRDRRARHLAAARHFEAIGDDELAGALASHYLAAYEASPAGAEAEAVGVQARLALKAAAERAAGLGSHDQAVAYLMQAIGVTTDPVERAELLERAAVSSSVGGRHGEAETLFREAIAAHEARGDRSAMARAIAGLADSYLGSYRAHVAVALVEPYTQRFADMPDDPGVIAMNGQLARAYFFLEDYRRSQQVAEGVLEAAERLELLPVIADTLVTRGMGHSQLGRMYEGIGALEAGLRLAEAQGFNATIMRARTNLGGTLWFRDPRASLAATLPGLELARRLGRRTDEIILCTNAGYASLRTGDWRFSTYLEELLTADLDPADRRVVLQPLLHFRAFAGAHLPDAIEDLAVYLQGEADAQNVADYRRGLAAVALANGDLETAFRESMTAAEVSEVNGPAPYAVAGRAATWAGDRTRLEEALARHRASPPHGPALELERRTMEAALTAMDGRRSEAAAAYRAVLEGWRDLGCQFDFALTAIDAAQLVGEDAAVAPLIADARRILVALGTRPFVERLDVAIARRGAGVSPAARPGSAALASSPRA